MRFWNDACAATDNPLLRSVFESDLVLAQSCCVNAWTYEVRQAFKRLFPKTGDSRISGNDMSFLSLVSVNLPSVKSRLLASYSLVWEPLLEVEGYRVEDFHSREALTYAVCILQNSVLPDCVSLPSYLSRDNIDHAKSFAQFRLGSHFLRVETERFGSAPLAWVDRICSRCSFEYLLSLECGVDDEYHLLFKGL